MKMKVIKPEKNYSNSKSILLPIVYLILGIILAFKSNEAIKLLFYIIGILIIVYGVKMLITYYQNKNNLLYKSINLSISIISIIIGVLLIALSGVLEISIRYILGFFLIYIGVSKLFTQISFQNYKLINVFSNAVLILLGLYSILFSNAVLVIIGWLLILNAIILFWEYLKNK